MPKENPYKVAPCWLYKSPDLSSGNLFWTQEEVDEAWEDGWFGPPWLKNEAGAPPVLEDAPEAPPISNVEWGTKSNLRSMVKADPRYSGLKFSGNMTTENMINALVEFEVRKGIGEE